MKAFGFSHRLGVSDARILVHSFKYDVRDIAYLKTLSKGGNVE
jgi:hypothetical protein